MCVVGYTSYASSVHICMSTLWLASGFDPCAIYWLIKYLDIYIYIDKVPGCWECAPLVSPFPPLHFRHPVAATPGSIGDDNDEDVDDGAIRTRDTGFLGSATIVNCILIWWTCGNIANQLYLQEIMVMLSRVWHTGTGNSWYPAFFIFLVVSEKIGVEKSHATDIGQIWYRKKSHNRYWNWFLLPKFRNLEDVWWVPVAGIVHFSGGMGTGIGKI